MSGALPPIRQIGYAVRDVEVALADFRSLTGVTGEAARYDVMLGADCHYRYRGQPAVARLDVVLVNDGLLDHEFVQVLEGPHPARDFLEKHGEGINHLGFYVGDLAPPRDHVLQLGGKIIAQGDYDDPESPTQSFVYMAFENRPTTIYEFVQLTDLSK
jgi:methylmalonyl-CoA/ethylmalonyl-CoA epimerase